jgi:CRP/FNR family transcriptional regulator
VEENVEMIIFPVSKFQLWLNQDSVRNFVFHLFSLRFAHVITLIEEIIFRKMDNRLAKFLVDQFENRGKLLRSISFTQEQIAAELGTAREVINRLLKEFERLGAINSSRGIIRLSSEKLLKDLLIQ